MEQEYKYHDVMVSCSSKKLDSFISGSNSFKTIVEFIENNPYLYKEFIQARDKMLQNGCQSTAMHICGFIEDLFERRDY